MKGVGRMTEVLHPGLILILTAFIALAAPYALRAAVMLAGTAASVYAAFNLPAGTDLMLPVVDNIVINYLHADKLSLIFTLIFSIMAFIGAVYSLHNKSRMEALCSMSYAGCAIGVTLAGDWITLIFFWEALAVSSLFLIWGAHTEKARTAGFRYLLVHFFGGSLLLLGISFKVYAGDFSIAALGQGPHDLAFWFILAGVAVNAAIPPLNAWLVDAYPEGSLTGSVFLSSFTTKVAVYCLIRIFAGVDYLMWIGAFMALYGACYAIMENDMRRLLSYHIISQVGFMVAGTGIGTGMALNGASAHAFSHILYKSLLFMCAGALIYATGIRSINKLGGLFKKLPFVAVCFFVAAFSISGVPFFNGFISKTITIAAAEAAGQSAIYTLLELASIGTFLSITLKMGYFIFIKPAKADVEIKNALPLNMYAGIGIGAALCFVYGVCPPLLYAWLPFEAPAYNPYTAEHILQYVQVLTVTIVPFMLLLGRMEPHTALSLDTDWFYRKPFAALISGLSGAACAMCTALSSVWAYLYDRFNMLTANPMQFMETEQLHKEPGYDPNNYRSAISETMMITLTVLVCAIGYFLY